MAFLFITAPFHLCEDIIFHRPGQLRTKRTVVLSPNHVRSRSCKIGCYNGRIALKLDNASRQRCCRGACPISRRLKYSKLEYRDFETSRDLAVRYLSALRIEYQEQFSQEIDELLIKMNKANIIFTSPQRSYRGMCKI